MMNVNWNVLENPLKVFIQMVDELVLALDSELIWGCGPGTFYSCGSSPSGSPYTLAWTFSQFCYLDSR